MGEEHDALYIWNHAVWEVSGVPAGMETDLLALYQAIKDTANAAIKDLTAQHEADQRRIGELEKELEARDLERAGQIAEDLYCDACLAKIEPGVNGEWYWRWHRSRDRRGGWYCDECGPLVGTTDQEQVPCPCPCPDCTGIDERRAQNVHAYVEALKNGHKGEWAQFKERAERAESDLSAARAEAEKWEWVARSAAPFDVRHLEAEYAAAHGREE